jgi:mannose-6-phosphate isomerase-like protein (cupin superfamily)
MIIRNLASQKPFTTKDGSRIRSILDAANAPVHNQSLAEASVPPGGSTERHRHLLSEEFYFILEGSARMEVGGEVSEVAGGDGILIPAGEWHAISSEGGVRFLCCCSPPYAHEDTYFQ